MARKSDILEGLGSATPALRRYARALCATTGPAVADDLVQSALQSIGARVRARELRLADHGEARIETYATLTALAAQKLASGAAKSAPGRPQVVQGLADLHFDDRAALLLVSLEGFGYDAAARIAGVSREMLLTRLMRARGALMVDALLGVDSMARRASHLRVVK